MSVTEKPDPDTIEITNNGPVERITIPVPIGGGITLLRGGNDTGKSLTLEAIQKLLGGKQSVSQREGADERGCIEGFGVTITFAASTRKKGELEATSIEGKLSIAELIDPGLKDPNAADRARTKALCRLLGVEARPELFHDALGMDDFAKVVTDHALAPDDVVEMQRRIKADCDRAAKAHEDTATCCDGAARSLREAAEGSDLTGEDDADILQSQLEQAIKAEAVVHEQRKEATRRQQAAREAREEIEKAEANCTLPSAAEAITARNDARRKRDATLTAASEAYQAYTAASNASDAAEGECRTADAVSDAAKNHEEAIAGWAETVEASAAVEPPTQEQIDVATTAIVGARDAVEHGVRIRDAKTSLKGADEAKTEANQLRAHAERLRDSGRDTEKVLAEVVHADTLTLKGGRWMTQVEGRGAVPYHERSRGTRAAIAIDLAARRIRQLGAIGKAIIPFPQEVWEGLDYANRQKLLAQAKRLNVNLITAEADRDASDEGDLRAEVYGGIDHERPAAPPPSLG